MTPSILFIVLVIVLGTLALGWSFYRQQFKRAPEPDRMSHNMPLPSKRLTNLRTRLSCALVALSFAGLTLLLGPHPPALAASALKLTNLGSYLTTNQYLSSGDYLESGNGQYFAIMQSDGNFVLYRGSGPSNNLGAYWATNTYGQSGGAFFAIMQGDGNFAVYKGTGPSNNLGYVWAARNTALPTDQYFAIMQDDGNFVVYHGSGPSNNLGGVWATNTVAGVGANLSIVSNNNQTLPRVMYANGTPYAKFAPLSVAFKDNTGNPLIGKTITWSATNNPTAMDVQILPDSFGPATSTTNANGIATLNQIDGKSAWAYNADGTFNIVASSGSASVTFNFTVGGTPSSILSTTIVAGNNQSVARTGTQVSGGIAVFAPLQVKVLNANGTPASGVQVGFSVGSAPSTMVLQFDPYGSNLIIATTDANGIATLNSLYGNSMQCYNASGPFTIQVYTTDGSMTPVTFNETIAS